MSYKGFNPVAFARNASTTLAHHIREVEQAFLRNYQIGAILESNGRVNYNNSGEGFDWPVQYRIHNVEGNTGQTPRNFARRNLWKTAYLEFRGYQATDAMYYREFLSNRGPEGIVKVYDQFTERITQSVKQALGSEYYVDGEATGYEQSWHGLETIFNCSNDSGNVQTLKCDETTPTARNAATADIVGYPQTTYAGLSTELGNYGGENESGEYWPDGVADPEFDFWTPLVVNYTTSHSDLGGDNNWASQGTDAMRYAIINSQRNVSMEGQITNILLARDLYRTFLEAIDNKERIVVSSETGLRALGFKNVVNFDGVEVSWEVAVPTGVGYGINYNQMELKSMDSVLLRSEGPEYDIDSQSFNAVVSTLSNLAFRSPRNFFKLAALA